MDRVNRKSFGSSNRSATDILWTIFFFFFIFILWTMCLYGVSYHRQPPIDSDHSRGRSWIYDAITCNLASLKQHYEDNGSIVISTNVLIGVFLVMYSLSSMPNNNMFQSQLSKACFIFIALRVVCSFLIYIDSTPLILEKLLIRKKMLVWLIPEAILIIVWYAKSAYTDDRLKYYYNEMCYFREYYCLLVAFTAIPLLFFGCFLEYISSIVQQVGWNSLFSYTFLGISVYIGFTFFYFWLMVISCTVDMEMDYESKDHRMRFFSTKFFHALWIIARYHLGTVCYHASLIVPRLEALEVMNEPEFKKEDKFSKITERFHAAQCRVHDLTLMATAVGGTCYRDSVRELMRYHASGVRPKLECFQGFTRIGTSVLALILSTNSLTLIFLWVGFDIENHDLALGTWMFYLRLMLVFYTVMIIFDAVFNTILLHLKQAPFTSFDLARYFVDGGEQRGPII